MLPTVKVKAVLNTNQTSFLTNIVLLLSLNVCHALDMCVSFL